MEPDSYNIMSSCHGKIKFTCKCQGKEKSILCVKQHVGIQVSYYTTWAYLIQPLKVNRFVTEDLILIFYRGYVNNALLPIYYIT